MQQKYLEKLETILKDKEKEVCDSKFVEFKMVNCNRNFVFFLAHRANNKT